MFDGRALKDIAQVLKKHSTPDKPLLASEISELSGIPLRKVSGILLRKRYGRTFKIHSHVKSSVGEDRKKRYWWEE